MKNTIYTLTCPISLKVRYIGKTIDTLSNRLSKHINDRKKGKNRRCHWINKLYKQGLRPIIEVIDEAKDNDELSFLEKYWISQFKTWGFDLVNATDGGEGSFGYKHSTESLDKIIQKNKERYKNHIKKIKKATISKKEQSSIISKALSIPIIQYDLNGNKVKEWNSIIEAANFYDIYPTTICNSLKNHKKIANNQLWRYKSENTGDKINTDIFKGNKNGVKVYDSLLAVYMEFNSNMAAFDFIKTRPSNIKHFLDKEKLFKKRYKFMTK